MSLSDTDEFDLRSWPDSEAVMRVRIECFKRQRVKLAYFKQLVPTLKVPTKKFLASCEMDVLSVGSNINVGTSDLLAQALLSRQTVLVLHPSPRAHSQGKAPSGYAAS